MNRLRIGLLGGALLLSGVTQAQTPSPAQLGLVIATPNVVQVLDSSKNWATIGTINSTTHVFTPSGATSTPPGGTSGQVQYNNAGAFGGFTASGDATINTSTGAVAVTKTGGAAFGALATVTPGTGVAAALGVNVGTAGSFVVNGGALGTPSSGTLTNVTGLPVAGVSGLGTGVATALAAAANTNGGVATATTTSVVAGAINTGGGSGTAPVGLADVATGSYLKSGGVTTIPAWQAFGTNVQTAVNTALNANGGLATAAAPLTAGSTGSLTGAFGYYICTTTCTITLPTPAAGFQFCIRNDSTVVTVITIAAISSVQFEKTTYNGYGTVTTGKMTSGGALGDKICLVGRDAAHYLVGSFVGTWTNT